MTSWFRIAAFTFACLAAGALPAAAHPLGNFTINHLTRLAFARQRVTLRYVLDMAEIPTFQAMREREPSGRMTPAELAGWAERESRALLPQLRLSAGGTDVPLAFDGAQATTRPGAGGLPTLYLKLEAHGDLAAAAAPRTFAYQDRTFAGRLGWKDVAVAPATEPTRELTAYPNALLGSPRDTSAVEVRLTGNGSATVVARGDASNEAPGAPSAMRANQLSDMLARGTRDPGFVVLTFLVALALGALHALEPGHGKTLLAVSLVGARATVRQAVILAAALTFAHTIGVLALGLAINLFKDAFVPESIYPWITLGSGIVIAIVGARAVERQILLRRPYAHVHAHEHPAAHVHAHEHAHVAFGHAHHHHSHDHDDLAHARVHAIPGEAPLRFGPAVWAAMSGGVAPCPAALVVLLAAIALDQVTYGLFVVVAFSFGLATTLTALGIGVVRGATWLARRPQFDRLVAYAPLASAIAIAAIGIVMVGRGFAAEGIPVSPVLVSALAALAIVGYAFSHPFGQRAETA